MSAGIVSGISPEFPDPSRVPPVDPKAATRKTGREDGTKGEEQSGTGRPQGPSLFEQTLAAYRRLLPHGEQGRIASLPPGSQLGGAMLATLMRIQSLLTGRQEEQPSPPTLAQLEAYRQRTEQSGGDRPSEEGVRGQ